MVLKHIIVCFSAPIKHVKKENENDDDDFWFFFFPVTKLEDWELPNTNFDKLQLCNIVDVKYDLGNTSSNNRCCDVMQLQRIDLIRRFSSCSIKINIIDEFLAGSFQSNWFTFIAMHKLNLVWYQIRLLYGVT